MMKKKRIIPTGFDVTGAATELYKIFELENFLQTHDYTNLSDAEQNVLIALYVDANLSPQEQTALYKHYKKRDNMPKKPKSIVSREITERFIYAIDALVQSDLLPSRRVFCLESGYAESNFSRLVHDNEKTISLWMLCFLCEYYPVNADWLLVGRGEWKLKVPSGKKRGLST